MVRSGKRVAKSVRPFRDAEVTQQQIYLTVDENWKYLTPDIDRLSPKMIEEHTEEAIAFILAAVKRSH